MKVKVFNGSTPKNVEQDVNDWLTLHPKVRIEHVLQSECTGSDEAKFNLTISIFYQDNSETMEAPARAESRVAAAAPELEPLPLSMPSPTITS